MTKKTKIRTIIRQIVREEVAMAINEVITELKQPTQIMTSTTDKIRKNKKPKKKVVEKKQFTKNSILNDVLNETAQSDEWKTMGEGTYDSSKMNQVMSSQYGDLMTNGGDINADAMIASMGEDPSTVDDNLKKVFTRDYRKLMKTIDDKKGSK